MNWPWPVWIAHRGGGLTAPENTLAALRAGARAGFRMVEFDVMLSADGMPVLMHDDTLERTTNGRGPVSAQDLAALRMLDAGAWQGSAYAGERIPTLDEALDLLCELDLDANIEIKPAPGFSALTGVTVAREVARRWPADRRPPLLSSFDEDALAAAAATAPALPRGLLFEQVPDDWARRMQGHRAVSVHCDHRLLDAARLQALIDAGVPVLCYTVNDATRARGLLAAGVRGLFTDRLDLPEAV
ncbi:glycerophosphodiester phosphodiesterase [Methyloversatilis thermotolerans]|uniref:glycerophosphodiester phosphodiesterase n=1 Tax=Methyloversatilis thermotolerans TaxID=1346290 RepID=UPI000380AD9A|nr:glycerophosphodiester phosphodiesterase [Methyloversatilis thermotolerans]